MSEINLGFVVEPNNINIVADNNNINFTPTETTLTVYSGGFALAGGSNTQLQYNNNGAFGGIPNVTYNGSKLSLGNVANVLMTGGTNGYVLQTDGTGNLSWTAQTGNGGGGNGTPGGSNTQIQYNDAGSFGGNAGFTFNEVSGNVNLPNDLIVAGTIYGNFSGNSVNANYANYSGTSFNVNGSNVSGQVAYAAVANNVAGGNVLGTVANATFATSAGSATSATTAGTVTTNAQPNITSVGTLANLNVTGNTILNSTTSIQQALEKVTIYNTANTGTVNYDILDQAIIYNTAVSTGNIALNVRGNGSVTANSILAVGNSAVITYVLSTGAADQITSLAIDGTSQTIRWAGNSIPNSYSYTAMSYTFNIIKTATAPTYSVFGSATRYG